MPPAISSVQRGLEEWVPCAEPAVLKEEALNEAYRQAGMAARRGARLLSVPGIPSAAVAAVPAALDRRLR